VKVIILAAVTIDGKLARNAAHFSNWTSREDKRIFVQASKQAGVLVLGNNTYKTLPAPLSGRLHIVMTRNPSAEQGIPGVVEFTAQSPEEIVADLEARGYAEIALAGGAQVNSLFLAAGLVDELWLTVEPVIFGQGVDLFSGFDFDLRAKLTYLEQLNEDGAVHLRYRLK
jgi:dihydrofolate reductase